MNIFINVVFGLILTVTSWINNTAVAQTYTNTTNTLSNTLNTRSTETINQSLRFYEPTPKIIEPVAGKTVTGTVNVKIYIEPTVVQKMEVYAGTVLIGLARAENSSNWALAWDSNKIPDGVYDLWARATITTSTSFPVDTFSTRIKITVQNGHVDEGSNITTQFSSRTNTATDPGTSTSNTSTSSTDRSSTASSLRTGTTNTTSTTAVNTAETPASNTETAATPIASSQLQTVRSLNLAERSNNHLEKIEQKIDDKKQNYLVFSGQAPADSLVTLQISSQIIVVSTRANSNGQWEYVFEKPLEPGSHNVSVQIIDPNGSKVESGPFPFTIAKAESSAENPTGAGLSLEDPNQRMLFTYYMIAAAIVVLAIIALLFIRSRVKRQVRESAA